VGLRVCHEHPPGQRSLTLGNPVCGCSSLLQVDASQRGKGHPSHRRRRRGPISWGLQAVVSMGVPLV